MFRPILSAMSRNKTGATLVAMQIAIALAVIVNALFIVQQRNALIQRDTGMAVDEIIAVRSFGFAENYDQQGAVDDDLLMLRNMPGVVSADYSRSIPLSGSGSATSFRPDTSEDSESAQANYYFTTPDIVQTLGIELAAGRSFRPDEMIRVTDPDNPDYPKVAIATRAFLADLFPDATEYVGKTFYSGQNGVEVVGVIEQMHGSWVTWDELNNVVLMPLIDAGPVSGYLIRTEQGAAERLLPEVEEALGASNRTRLINFAQTMKDIADRSYSRDRGMIVALSIVIALLVIVTALGIVGLAAFNVRARTKQIGTRRAVGATRGDILQYFFAENWLLTTGGIVVGVVLTYVLNYYLATLYSLSRLDNLYVPVGIFIMWGLGFLAVLGPARRASLISPAVATRTV
ncbi:MAG: FtsX-like permease family protein [Pseudomonadota bacterium]